MPFTSFDEFERLLLLQGVVKDNPLQFGKPRGIPVVQIGFQNNSIRTLIGCRDAFYQFVWARAPRASAFNDSPTLLSPAELPIELAVAHMHGSELGQGSTVWLWKNEADGVWIEDLEARPSLEVQKFANPERLL